jgi:hypothetical protein
MHMALTTLPCASALASDGVTTAEIAKFYDRQCQAVQARCMTRAFKKSVFFLLSNAHLPSPTSFLMMWHSGQGPPPGPGQVKSGGALAPPRLHGARATGPNTAEFNRVHGQNSTFLRS